jgi:L-alanine-DL-glutamate epimerase-like enolase superfamily enzyme
MPTLTHIVWKTVVHPMRTTFATSLGSKTCATSVIVTVHCSDGSVGVGEVPTSFVVPHETVSAIRGILSEAKPFLCGKDIHRWSNLINTLRVQYPAFCMTVSGLETALFRAWLNSQGKSELAFWGGKTKTIETDITIPFVPEVSTLEPWIQKAIRTGFNTYKIKVSGHVNTDLNFILAIHRYLIESGKVFVIRLDGNQGFTASSAMRLLDRLNSRGIAIELFEQPLKRDDYKGLNLLTREAAVPIIADETVFCLDDCKRVIDDRLAHGINIKIAKSGIAESGRILKLAKQAGLKVMIGCMTETMVGLSAAIHLAAGTGAFDYIDLDSIHFLHHRKHYDKIAIDGRFYHLGKHK